MIQFITESPERMLIFSMGLVIIGFFLGSEYTASKITKANRTSIGIHR